MYLISFAFAIKIKSVFYNELADWTVRLNLIWFDLLCDLSLIFDDLIFETVVELTHKITWDGCFVCRICFEILIGPTGVYCFLRQSCKVILSLRFCSLHERWISLSLFLSLLCQSPLRFVYFLGHLETTSDIVEPVYFLSLLFICYYLFPFFRFIFIYFKSLKLDIYLTGQEENLCHWACIWKVEFCPP